MLLLSSMLQSCSLEDWRDDCCYSYTMQYRFIYPSEDVFSERVHSMEYYLFTSEGEYLYPLQAYDGDISRADLRGLFPGSYTLVGIGNHSGYGTLSSVAEEGLEGFSLRVSRYSDTLAGLFGNGDPLYYGIRSFVIEEGGSNSYITDMSHIHCSLHVRVEWEGLPLHREGYRFRLDGVGTGVDMHIQNADYIDDLPYPMVHEYSGSMIEDVPLRKLSLESRLYTLRYRDTAIPVFTLYNGSNAVTKGLDLRRVFEAFGWRPDSTPVQEYRITVLIKGNGDIEVRQGFDAGVGDWIDGGTLGLGG